MLGSQESFDKFADQSRASTVDATGIQLVERGAYSVVMRFE
jgi:hypothetical protein